MTIPPSASSGRKRRSGLFRPRIRHGLQTLEAKWSDFCENLQYKNRFFNVRSKLDKLFGKAAQYKEGKRRPLYSLREGTEIYRARKLAAGLTRESIEKDTTELGMPPEAVAAAGRMNFQHISVFYAAFEAEVAVREVQPYIDEEVAVGKFVLNRAIKVFDFTIYDKLFDQHYPDEGIAKYRDTRYEAIHHIHQEISKPVSADLKSLNYIPTQILTEYIREKFKVDGIIFFSSLISKKSSLDRSLDRRNIVIFEKDEEIPILPLKGTDICYKRVQEINYDITDVALDPYAF